jgi:hypothetical protein
MGEEKEQLEEDIEKVRANDSIIGVGTKLKHSVTTTGCGHAKRRCGSKL